MALGEVLRFTLPTSSEIAQLRCALFQSILNPRGGACIKKRRRCHLSVKGFQSSPPS